jgi:HD-like signal output (HDOD) protein
MIDIDDLIAKASTLQPLPASAVQLASLIASGNSDLDEIGNVIAYDQALTLKLLRAANSAHSASLTPITDARDAVFRLGTARVLALSVAANVNPLLKRDVSQYGLGEGDLWRHSVASAVAAEMLPDYCKELIPPETFAAALLHDIGKLVMGRFLSVEILGMLHRATTEGGLDPCAAESQILRVHHGELGGIVAQHWNLPESIVKGIIYHHTPSDGNHIICDAVSLANQIAKSVEKRLPPPTVLPSVLERLGVPANILDHLTGAATRSFEKISARYNAT